MQKYLILLFYLFILDHTLANEILITSTQAILDCNLDSEQMITLFRDKNIQEKIGLEWSSTHDITDFTMTEWTLVDDISKLHEFDQYEIKPNTKVSTHLSTVDYNTVIDLPGILKTILGLDNTFNVNKRIISQGNTIHVIAEINNVPIIRHANIYTKMTFYNSGRIIVKNLIRYDKFPFYLSWAHGSVQNALTKSLQRNIDITSKIFCE